MEWDKLNTWTQASIIWAPVWVAAINMIGSVLIAWIRASYQITEKANGSQTYGRNGGTKPAIDPLAAPPIIPDGIPPSGSPL